MNRGLLYKILIVSFMCLYLLTTYSHAQFFPGTLIKIGKGGITQKIEISDNDKVIKNDKGEEIGRITNYDGQLIIEEGTEVEIREAGGLFRNIRYSKGKAKYIETFILNGISVWRELTYTDGTPEVTKCLIENDSTKTKFYFKDGSFIDLREPDVIVRLNVVSPKTRSIFGEIIILPFILLFFHWIIMLIDAVRRPSASYKFGRKWLWVILLLLLGQPTAIVYHFTNRWNNLIPK